MRNFVFALVAAVALATPALATPAAAADWYWPIEVRGGILQHDIDLKEITSLGQRKENGQDINLQFRWQSPDFFKYILAPQPYFGGTWSTAGDTSHVHAGLVWGYDWQSGLITEAFFGLARHTGTANRDLYDAAGNRTPTTAYYYNEVKRYGSKTLFHLGAELGWRFTQTTSLSLYWEHLSNGHILADGSNPGLDNLGLRLGYKFD